jgi:hypothetical protein
MMLDQVKKQYKEELSQMIDEEAEDVIRYYTRMRCSGQKKMKWQEAREVAEERVCNWIEEGDQINLSNALAIARLISSCRRAKAWATVIGMA